jgi:ethanolamine utilization microcompartment shell protein EutS
MDSLVWINDLVHTYREDFNAYSTIVIAFFTAILGIFTITLSRSTRIAAKAAQKSADALMGAEGSSLFVLVGDDTVASIVAMPGSGTKVKVCGMKK